MYFAAHTTIFQALLPLPRHENDLHQGRDSGEDPHVAEPRHLSDGHLIGRVGERPLLPRQSPDVRLQLLRQDALPHSPRPVFVNME